MKTKVPEYFASLPADLLKDTVNVSGKGDPSGNCTTSSLLPPLTDNAGGDPVTTSLQVYRPSKPVVAPQNKPRYRNVFNDRAKRDFCYWLVERKAPTCKSYSMGAYKTFLGLPKL